MDPESLTQVAQFGTAGLMAWMWLSERRAAATRERELSEAHARLMAQREQVDALLSAVRDNARAAGLLEAGQRAIASAVERIADGVAALARGPALGSAPGSALGDAWRSGPTAPARSGAVGDAPGTLRL